MAHRNSADDDIQKLLELAEGKIKEKEKTPERFGNVERFIRKMGIKTGETAVPAFLIHYYYCDVSKWSKLPKIRFFMEFAKYFKSLTYKNEVCYMLDESSFDMSKETLFKARAHRRKHRESEKKKIQKNKKKK